MNDFFGEISMGSSHDIDLYVSYNHNFCADRKLSFLDFNRHKNHISAIIIGRWRDANPLVYLKNKIALVHSSAGSFFGILDT